MEVKDGMAKLVIDGGATRLLSQIRREPLRCAVLLDDCEGGGRDGSHEADAVGG